MCSLQEKEMFLLCPYQEMYSQFKLHIEFSHTLSDGFKMFLLCPYEEMYSQFKLHIEFSHTLSDGFTSYY